MARSWSTASNVFAVDADPRNQSAELRIDAIDLIISLLLFAGFFYFMMRYGCGSHMVHGHHHEGQGTGPATAKSSKDPVCGMEVQAGRGYTEVFSGHEYRFCSRKCLDKFDAKPDQFVHA